MPTVCIVDQAHFSMARGYLRACSLVPVANSGTLAINAQKVFDVANMKLTQLLEGIATNCQARDDVALVSHGVTQGLDIKLGCNNAAQDPKMSADALNLLSGSRSDAQIAPMLFLTESQVASLRALRQRVVDLNLQRVELVACEVGSYESTLSAMKRFFGCQTVGGPEVRYGWLTATFVEDDDYDYDRYSQGGNGQLYTVDGGHVGFHVSAGQGRSLRLRNARVTSRAVLQAWAQQNFPLRSNITGLDVTIHGHWTLDRMVLPLESGFQRNMEEFSQSGSGLGELNIGELDLENL